MTYYYLLALVIIAIGVGISFLVEKRGYCRYGYGWRALYGAGIAALVAPFLLAMGAMVVAETLVTDDYFYHSEYPIVAASDGTSVSGGGFLIFHLTSDDTYRYYSRRGDGGITQHAVPTRDTVIYEDVEDGDEPRIVRLEHPDRWGPFPIPTGTPHFEFHVPAGSVKTDITFDLE